MAIRVAVRVMLKSGVLDPQGRAVEHALHSLGFHGAGDVRVGKVITLRVDAADIEAARAQAGEMARRLLANPVIEHYEVEILP